jgi:prepilin-type N-terminal cleavage/methylation domain-containing protein
MKRAFTLVEILAVIAIIAVLAAIVFPVFAKVKVSAQVSGSVSNISQLGKAYLLYTSDNNDQTPYVGDLGMIVDLRKGKISYASFPQYIGQKEIKETLMPYVKEELVWKSPSDPGGEKFLQGSYFDYYGSSYGTISDWCSGTLSTLKSPSQSVLLRELDSYVEENAVSWRADGSAKNLTWQESSTQMDRAYADLGCLVE